MQFDALYEACAFGSLIGNSASVEIAALSERADEVQPGTLFFCVSGATRDGHEFAPIALARGAVALVVERRLPYDVPQLLVEDVRAAMGPIASAFFGRPGDALDIIGITGTNGKTTTAQVLCEIFRFAGKNTRVIGTLTSRYTSPPPIQLQEELARFVQEGVEVVVMEVSSHALVQHRVDPLRFCVGVFTNLSQDHLDFHHDMESYFAAKAMLFEDGRCEHAIVNVDDAYGQRMAKKLLSDKQSACDVHEVSLTTLQDLSWGENGAAFFWRGMRLCVPLLGEFNISNALCAAEAANLMGIAPAVIADSLDALPQVPGRIERILEGQPFTVIVDFAHTPDGLANILRVARQLADAQGGDVLTMFGCGGDRDREKRPKMAAIAESQSEYVVVTSDNPRSEPPEKIIAEICAGFAAPDRVYVEPDRATAIRQILQRAHDHDVVVLAGKGHETVQIVGTKKNPFDDRDIARRLLQTIYNKDVIGA